MMIEVQNVKTLYILLYSLFYKYDIKDRKSVV